MVVGSSKSPQQLEAAAADWPLTAGGERSGQHQRRRSIWSWGGALASWTRKVAAALEEGTVRLGDDGCYKKGTDAGRSANRLPLWSGCSSGTGIDGRDVFQRWTRQAAASSAQMRSVARHDPW